MNIRWMRVVLGALLLEVILGVVLIPLSFVNTTLFLTAVPIGCFVFGYLVTKWLLRKLSSGLVVHGALIGVVATLMYFGLVVSQPNGLASALGIYGAALFYFSNAMRIAGCIAGAMHQQRQAAVTSPSAASLSARART